MELIGFFFVSIGLYLIFDGVADQKNIRVIFGIVLILISILEIVYLTSLEPTISIERYISNIIKDKNVYLYKPFIIEKHYTDYPWTFIADHYEIKIKPLNK